MSLFFLGRLFYKGKAKSFIIGIVLWEDRKVRIELDFFKISYIM